MLRLALALSLLTICPALAQDAPSAEPSDFERVRQTVNYYLEGGTNNDFETLRKAFHPEARMRFVRDGYQDVNAVEFFSRMGPGPAVNRRTRIAAIDVAGDAAVARLELEYPTATLVDYMTLLKIDGEWQIVHKAFSRRSNMAAETD